MTKSKWFWAVHCELVRRRYEPAAYPGVLSKWEHRSGLRVEFSRRGPANLKIIFPDGSQRTHTNVSLELALHLLDDAEKKVQAALVSHGFIREQV